MMVPVTPPTSTEFSLAPVRRGRPDTGRQFTIGHLYERIRILSRKMCQDSFYKKLYKSLATSATIVTTLLYSESFVCQFDFKVRFKRLSECRRCQRRRDIPSEQAKRISNVI